MQREVVLQETDSVRRPSIAIGWKRCWCRFSKVDKQVRIDALILIPIPKLETENIGRTQHCSEPILRSLESPFTSLGRRPRHRTRHLPPHRVHGLDPAFLARLHQISPTRLCRWSEGPQQSESRV